jgi:hypothetical protein
MFGIAGFPIETFGNDKPSLAETTIKAPILK